ncbi:MAG: hypothetical protein WCO96_08310 [Actinomycetes bacterium]
MPETRIQLPAHVAPPVDVFVNGVPLVEGDDFVLDGHTLVVKRSLAKEGNLGFWRWFLGAWGIGTYRKNDVVDVRYARDGVTKVAHDLDFEVPSDPGS